MSDAADTTIAERASARDLLPRTLRIASSVGAISTVIAFVFGQRFWTTFVFSASIGTGCWFFIDCGRMLAARWMQRDRPAHERGGWPGWGPMAPIVVVGTALGYTVGNAFASLVLGVDSDGLFSVVASNPKQAAAMLGFSLVPAFGATYFFYSRARIAEARTRALAAQHEAAENQLRLLQSQLEPHMLFNTLANLRVLIATDPPRAQAMLDQLIAFLRATLAASRTGSHALADEFARLRDYLALMQVRLGDRLRFDFDLPPQCAGATVPPLLLQPLVENCIKHAIEPSVTGGSIGISAAREGTQLVLRVTDTGAGAGDTDPAPDSTRFGLAQVRERLAALHGAAASLTLEPARDGTVATLRLPFQAGP